MKRITQFKQLLVFSFLLTFIFPTSLVQNSYRADQDNDLNHSPGLTKLQGKIFQNCQSIGQCALRFNGENQWVSLEGFHGFDTAAFTLETWFRWTGSGTPIPGENEGLSDGIPLISFSGSEGAGTATNLMFGIQASTGKLIAVFKAEPSADKSLGWDYSILGDTQITSGIWHHGAVSYDGQTWSLYLDGNLDGRLSYATSIMPQVTNAQNAYLAAALSSNGNGWGFFQGDLDEVRIWETTRTPQDIQAALNLEDVTDPNLIGHLSMNEGTGTEENESSGKGILGEAVNNPIWTDGAPFNLSIAPSTQAANATDAAPNPPTLVSPADGATSVSTSPTLNVTVSDSDTTNLTVTFYGRATPGTHSSDFTVVALPDTQKYTINGLGIFGTQTQWIVNQRSAQNIVFVTHLGDMVDDWDGISEWEIADAAMSKLETPGIPYGISIGNCDEDNYGDPPDNNTMFNTYFPASRFLGRSYYGGSYYGDNSNSYQLFSASGMNFIIIHLQYKLSYSPDGILAWADSLLKTYSNRRAIVVEHNLLTYDNDLSTDGSLIYNSLKDNPNLFLMLGGHLETEGRRQDLGDDGHTIYSLRSDYQTRTNGGNGWLRLLRFSPDDNKIYVTTYSPYLNQYETDANSQFSLDYNMNGTSFQMIGTTTVASGATASMNWPNLVADRQYQWYVTVNDGTSTTTGPTWGFTTGNVQTAPVITTQPTSKTVATGQTATFTAAANGNPAPTVQWQVSVDAGVTWVDISGATSTTYSFTAQSSDNGKQYRAVFTNSVGSATSNAATLTISTPPTVTVQPVSLTVNTGQTATFTATANGNPTPTVQWQVSTNNGSTWVNISGATTTSYSFIAQAGDNNKQYHAVFTNSAGSTTTNAAILTVYFAPIITTQPANTSVNAGQTATFTTAVNGNPTPTVLWQVSLDNGVSWNYIVGATSTTYSFTTQAIDNGNQYRAVFTNTLGSATSSIATLTVNTAPIVTTQPVNQSANAGQTAAFTAAASGNPTPTVQWQVSANNGSTWTNISGATSTTYSFTAQSGDNGKQYHAVFTNAAGSAMTSAATLTVYYAPTVTTQPTNKTVNAGQTAAFTAAANGNPTPSVQWQVSLDNGASWNYIAGATSTTYSFTTQAIDNGNQYRAVFTNSIGSTNSNTATLTVYFAPTIVVQPVNKTANAGQTVTFTTAASGSPTPTVQWQVSANGTNWTNIAGATSTTYSFTVQVADNDKQYRAVFTNIVGSTNSNAAILTVYFAPTVTTHPSNQTVNAGATATFSAAASGNPAPTVQWQVSSNGTNWTNISGATSTTYSFTAQSTDHNKHYRAVFTNPSGSATSNGVVLTVNYSPTIAAQPTDQIVNAGHTATFTAAANGNPTPTVQWQVSTNGTDWDNIAGATSTTYSFTAQIADNGKQYRAVFSNLVGSVNSNSASLTVNFAPEVTTHPNEQTINPGKSVNFSAVASGNPTPTVQWQVSTNNGSTWTDIVGATSTTYTFTAKSENNGNQYRAVFTNLVGTVSSNPASLTVNDYVLFLPVVNK